MGDGVVLVLVLVQLDGPLLAALLGAANPMEGRETGTGAVRAAAAEWRGDVVQGHPATLAGPG